MFSSLSYSVLSNTVILLFETCSNATATMNKDSVDYCNTVQSKMSPVPSYFGTPYVPQMDPCGLFKLHPSLSKPPLFYGPIATPLRKSNGEMGG